MLVTMEFFVGDAVLSVPQTRTHVKSNLRDAVGIVPYNRPICLYSFTPYLSKPAQ